MKERLGCPGSVPELMPPTMAGKVNGKVGWGRRSSKCIFSCTDNWVAVVSIHMQHSTEKTAQRMTISTCEHYFQIKLKSFWVRMIHRVSWFVFRFSNVLSGTGAIN